jgi:hypothetical protein
METDAVYGPVYSVCNTRPWTEIRNPVILRNNTTYFELISCRHALLLLLLLFSAIGLLSGSSSPTLVQTKIKITQNNKITTK